MSIDFAERSDIESWMELLEKVKGNFPGLNKRDYKNNLELSISKGQALVAKEDDLVIGALIFLKENHELAFLAVHPEFRRNGIAKMLIEKMISLFPLGTEICVTTYRKGDKLGIAARELYENMGFKGGELVTVFDYPCQRMVLTVE